MCRAHQQHVIRSSSCICELVHWSTRVSLRRKHLAWGFSCPALDLTSLSHWFICSCAEFQSVCTLPPFISCCCHDRGKIARDDARRLSTSCVKQLPRWRFAKGNLEATNQNVLILMNMNMTSGFIINKALMLLKSKENFVWSKKEWNVNNNALNIWFFWTIPHRWLGCPTCRENRI